MKAPETDGYEDGRIVRAELLRQLTAGKGITWTETTRDEFGGIPPVSL